MNVRNPVAWLLSVCLLAAPTAVMADDLAPAPFRGQPNSLMAKFDLFGGQVPGGPSQFVPAPNSTYPLDALPPFVGQPTTDPTNNALIYPIELPNFIDQEPIKYIRVQYSWFGALPGTGPTGDAQTLNITPQGPPGSVQLVGGTAPTLVPPLVSGAPNVYHRWDDFEIRPNPDREFFDIAFFDADPRWIIIDTISVPEPAAATLLALGGLLAVRRRQH